MYIISSRNGEKFNGQIANAVLQTTSTPPTVAICINKQNLTYEYIKKSKIFSISILEEETQMKIIGLFGFKSGREVDKFNNISYKVGLTGAPVVVENSLGYLECKVIKELDVGTHTLFIGELVDAEIIKEGMPMTYAFYREAKKGKSPKTAPTYIGEDTTKKEVKKMAKYVCTVCGYVYDPEIGDPDSGVKPGTAFVDLPDDWVCPICGVGKDQFEEEK